MNMAIDDHCNDHYNDHQKQGTAIMESVQYHIYDGLRGNRFCTFYDRRILADYIKIMFPLGTAYETYIQCDDGETVATLCTVNDFLRRGREWFMCL